LEQNGTQGGNESRQQAFVLIHFRQQRDRSFHRQPLNEPDEGKHGGEVATFSAQRYESLLQSFSPDIIPQILQPNPGKKSQATQDICCPCGQLQAIGPKMQLEKQSIFCSVCPVYLGILIHVMCSDNM
jgi:hypothetical protein